MILKPCATCGEPAEATYCPEHQPSQRRPSRSSGYDGAWDKLSARARKLQPWCSDCHTTDDLTCDHSPEAWRRKEAGKPIRLQDVDVVCRGCNAKRGAARGDTPTPTPSGARRQADFPSQSPGGYR